MNSFQLPDFEINPISERDGWRLCDFVCANADHIKRYFPKTVAANLNPTLSNIFVLEKIAEFLAGKEYLFTLKEPENRKIIGLIFLKELKKETQDSIISCHGQMLNHVKFLNAETKFILKPSIERKY